MIINFVDPVISQGVIVFPEASFPAQPLDPSQILETVQFQGEAGPRTQSVTGTADRSEGQEVIHPSC